MQNNVVNSINNDSNHIHIAALLSGISFFPVILSSFLFLLNISINAFIFPVAMIALTICYYFAFAKSIQPIARLKNIIAGSFICIALLYLSGTVLSFSYDGWCYHLPAVIKLSNGWNPVYQYNNIDGFFTMYYPKYAWIFGATVYKTTGNLFCANALTSIQLAATLLITLDFAKNLQTKNKIVPYLFALLLAANPIITTELFTYYNDGLLGNSIIILVLLFYGISKGYYKLSSKPVMSLLIANGTMLANIKFTGLVFLFAIISINYLSLLICKIEKSQLTLYAVLQVLVLALLASNTYIPNQIQQKHIFHPVMGENKIDIITSQTPKALLGDNKYIALLKSLTAETSGKFNNEYEYKLPFIVKGKELSQMKYTSQRTGGFGPLYQLILWFGITILLYNIILNTKKITAYSHIKKFWPEYTSIVSIIILLIIMPTLWYARFIPFLYAIPILPVLMSYNHITRNLINNILMLLLLITAITNESMIVLKRSEYHLNYSQKSFKLINELSNNNESHIHNICFSKENAYFQTTAEEILKNNDIKYKVISPSTEIDSRKANVLKFNMQH